ncbi:unnamed protein product [Acanthoscelides obtectus]|uniref:Uncharacterized protein n=1 Tax=Acanthoscelides obtectus TaxID=200917 RepID=A0A9P0PDJ5_ACAOB|nr:unnamed protein product [Acanthoscelides obtectus]CAK1656116.1 hypothetical protein AOBTE_LOCUS19576 [Acanthoscelides obtectus]
MSGDSQDRYSLITSNNSESSVRPVAVSFTIRVWSRMSTPLYLMNILWSHLMLKRKRVPYLTYCIYS